MVYFKATISGSSLTSFVIALC